MTQPNTMPEDQIEEVRKQAERQGKRPIDIAARRRSQLLKKKFVEALKSRNFDQFCKMLVNDLGQTPGSDEYLHSVQAWKLYHEEP
jgi:hypothetical protein